MWLSSCGSDSSVDPIGEQSAIDDQLIQDFLAETSITATKDDSGIYYYPIIENPSGETQQINGDILSIYYTVNVLNGQTLDEVLVADGDPVKLKQGVNAIVPIGLDVGLAFMRQGETYKFVIPSAMAFGTFSFSTLIPANSILEFEVELVNIENENIQLANEVALINDYIAANELNDIVLNPLDAVESLPSGVFYKRIRVGIEDESPLPGQSVALTYAGTFLDGTPFDAIGNGEPFQFVLASGVVIQGLDFGVAAMERGERSLLIMPSILAYGESVRVIPGYLAQDFVDLEIIPQYATRVSPYQTLVFDTSIL